ncbi:unnamed protein product [Cochlearia groenlandica]
MRCDISTHLVSSCKFVPDEFYDPSSAVSGLTAMNSDLVLQSFLFSLDIAYSKVVEHALDCVFTISPLSILRGEIESPSNSSRPFPKSVLY